MPEPEPKRPVRNAGAFLAPDGVGGPFAVPMSTLSDEYTDEPAEPEEDHEPEPEPPGAIRKAVYRLTIETARAARPRANLSGVRSYGRRASRLGVMPAR